MSPQPAKTASPLSTPSAASSSATRSSQPPTPPKLPAHLLKTPPPPTRVYLSSYYFRKDTYALLNALHGFRNFIEHTGGQVIPLGVAVSALMLSVELLACLNKSLEK
jgi:hypothetical protein